MVTASLSEQVVSDAIPFTTVIGRDVIEQSQSIDLPSLLRQEAGFQYTQNGGPGQTSTLYLRGSASMQVLVLIDGVPMTKQDTTGAVSLEHIMLDQVDHVEIVRGNVSAIYGSGAIGGVMQIFTRQGSPQSSASARVELGSRGSVREGLALSGKASDTVYSIAANHFQTRGISAMNPVQYPNENPDADGYHNDSYAITLRQNWAPGHSFGFKADGFSARFDTDGGGFGSPSDVYKGSSRRDNRTLDSRNQWTPDWRSELSLSKVRETSVYDALQTAYPYTGTNVTQTSALKWTNFVTHGKLVWTAGMESQQQALDSSDNTPSQFMKSRKVKAVFGGFNGAAGQHSWQLNLRHDQVESLGDKSTAYAGYAYQINQRWKWLLSASSAFNAPPLGYMYGSFGNPGLKPETGHSMETGVQWTVQESIVRATVFKTRTQDMLLWVPDMNPPNYGMFENISRSHNQGLEIIASGPWAGGNWRSSLTMQNPVDDGTGDQLARRARSMASVAFNRPWAGWRWGMQLTYTGARPDINSNPGLPAYVLANVAVRKTLSAGLELTARIDNLANKPYQTAYGYQQLGRMLYLGLNWQQR